MPFKVNDTGTWRESKPWVKVGGVWTEAKAWVKASGVWQLVSGTPVPSNMVLIYTDSIDLPAGASQPAYLQNLFPYSSSATPTNTESPTHDGADHGQNSLPPNDNSAQAFHTENVGLSNGTTNKFADSNFYHNHSIIHSHSTTSVSVEPTYNALLACTTTGGEITANAIFPTISTNVTLLTYIVSYALTNGNYIKFGDGTYSSGGSNTHSHAFTGNSGTYSISTEEISDSAATGTIISEHYHAIDHTHLDLNEPPYVYVGLCKTTKNIISLDELPSGVLAFFTSTVIPDGWSPYLNNGKFLRYSNSSLQWTDTGGSSTHSSTAYSGTTGTTETSGTQDSYQPNASGIFTFDAGSHSHNMAHAHPSTGSSMPPYVNLHLAQKD